MTLRPITFSTPMIHAIVDGRKTVTRRLINPQPLQLGPDSGDPRHFGWDYHNGANLRLAGEELPRWGGKSKSKPGVTYRLVSPYGDDGDRCWVRETHALCCLVHWPDLPHKVAPESVEREDRVCYYKAHFDRAAPRWRSPRFLPFWASRFRLRNVNVRAERLHEIDADDILREGFSVADSSCSLRDAFACGWDKINGRRTIDGGSPKWFANPWVWRYEFEALPELSSRIPLDAGHAPS